MRQYLDLLETVLATGEPRDDRTGVGTLSWNSQTWLGIGNMLEVSAVEETDSIEARGGLLVPGDRGKLRALVERLTSVRLGESG